MPLEENVVCVVGGDSCGGYSKTIRRCDIDPFSRGYNDEAFEHGLDLFN